MVTTEVYSSVNVSAEPEFGQRMLTSDPAAALNTVVCPGRELPLMLAVPVVYHDPDRELFILVLPESSRHRELVERAELLMALARDPAPVPAYVRDFGVVFGATELGRWIERQAESARQVARSVARAQELDDAAAALGKERGEMEQRSAELAFLRQEIERREHETEGKRAELERRASEVGRRESEVGRRERELEERGHTLRMAEKALAERLAQETSQARTAEDRDDQASAGPAQPEKPATPAMIVMPHATADVERRKSEVVITDLDHARPAGIAADPLVTRWLGSGEAHVMFVDASGSPRACVMAGTAEEGRLLDPEPGDAPGRPALDVRVQMHRLRSFPLIVLSVGAPESLAGQPDAARPLAIHFNIDDERDRQVLHALARDFSFVLDIYDKGHALKSTRRITAGLEDNVRYVLAAATEQLDKIPAKQRSFARAMSTWTHADYDRYGWNHPERAELREDKLLELGTAQSVRRALAIADRFTNPKREEYLFMMRGYPVRLWHRQRRAVLARAVELGIWVGSRLSPIAVDEGLASSRKDLLQRLQTNFASLQAGAEANDLDADAASDNLAALQAEAASLGGASEDGGKDREREDRNKDAAPRTAQRRSARTTPIHSDGEPVVSGSISVVARVADLARSARNLATDELLIQLGQDEQRVEAAIELARRREARAIAPVMTALAEMSRTEAVRVLGAMPSFGDQATSALIQGLGSEKSFVRQGCALALSVLKSEAAIEALSDQVIAEPTAIWKEVARGLGTIGPGAIMPLASRLAAAKDSARERVAWCLAHIAALGGKNQVQTLAGSRDAIVAGVARHALELVSSAVNDDLQVRGRHTPREQTVNRAFSRKFFQALEASSPLVDASATADLADVSNPAMVLDEADLLEATELEDDTAELLDDSDLIPT